MKILCFAAAFTGILGLAQGADEAWLQWDEARSQAVGKAAYVQGALAASSTRGY